MKKSPMVATAIGLFIYTYNQLHARTKHPYQLVMIQNP